MTVQPFKPPQLKTLKSIERTFLLGGNVPVAPSETTFVLGPISYPYRIKEIVLFQCDAFANRLNHFFFVSLNRNISTTGPPNDDNVFGAYGSSSFIVETIWTIPVRIPLNKVVHDRNTYLKYHVTNLTAGVVRLCSSTFTIEEIT